MTPGPLTVVGDAHVDLVLRQRWHGLGRVLPPVDVFPPNLEDLRAVRGGDRRPGRVGR